MKAICLFSVLSILSCSVLKSQTTFSIPFEQVRRLVVVRAMIKEGPAWFLVDTGAGDIVLNASNYSPFLTPEGLIKDSNGHDHQLAMTWVQLALGELSRKNEKAYICDLTHLEKMLGRNLHGVIGAEFFRNTELEIDYARQLLTIYPLDRRGEPVISGESRPEAVAVIPMKRKGHVLSLEAQVAGKTLRFGLDTGAEVNMLLEREKALLLEDALNERRLAVWSFSDQPAPAAGQYVMRLDVGPVTYDQMAMIMVASIPFNQQQPGPLLDGILGYPFLSHHLTAINFVKNELTLRELRQGAKRKAVLVENQGNRKTEKPGN